MTLPDPLRLANTSSSEGDDDGPARRLLLGRVRDLVAESVDGYVRSFYDRLTEEPGPRGILDRLTATEFDQLRVRQAEHLLKVLDPDALSEQAFEQGRVIGRIHAMAGVEIEWYARAMSMHHQEVFQVVASLPEHSEQAWLYADVASRMMNDLQAALTGYRDVDSAQDNLLVRVSEVVSRAGTVPDLLRGVLDACADLQGLAAAFFGRPDNEGDFQFEIGVGDGAEQFITELSRHDPMTITVVEEDPSGGGPSGRAWRSGRIERSDSYLTDPTTAPWHEIGAELGWRSSCAVPLADGRGAPRALLSFYSPWPGFFASASREAMIVQVKHQVERALVSLEARGPIAASVRNYSARTSYIHRLQTGQVEMVYQPIVDLHTGRTLKLEALARLKGDLRLVAPAEFLPAFGDDELVQLFALGLDQSLTAMRDWEADGLRVGVTLNLPSVSSHDERYVALVEDALGRHRVAPSRLTLELLEAGFIDGRSRWRGQVLDQFKSLGVRLAQDDLGSGYSSLLRLRHFDFDDVKLDQSLVRGQEFDPRGALNFISPLTSLVHNMGLQVIVEGLENRGLVEAALMLGADAGQGYGLSRPLHGDKVVEWTRTFRLDVDAERPRTHLGGLAGHVAWEQRLDALRTVRREPPDPDLGGVCPMDRYLEQIEDPGGHIAEAHAAVHRATVQGRGTPEHMRWWRVLSKMLSGMYD